MSAIPKILDILERFEAQKITAIRSNGRETAYEWSGKSGQKYRAWLTHNASRTEPNKHYVSVAFGTVHYDEHGNEVERVDSHDLPDDPTDTLETVHRITDHYLQKKVAKAHPDATHVVLSNDPVKSEKDKKAGKESPADTQRGSVYQRLLHRALKNNPRNAGVSSEVLSNSTGQHMHLGFPGGIGQHYETNGRSTLAHKTAVPESYTAAVSKGAAGAPPTMSRKGVATSEAGGAVSSGNKVDEALLLEFPHTDTPTGSTYDAELERFQKKGDWPSAMEHLKAIFSGAPHEDKWGGTVHLKDRDQKIAWLGELHSQPYMDSFLKFHGKTWADLHQDASVTLKARAAGA